MRLSKSALALGLVGLITVPAWADTGLVFPSNGAGTTRFKFTDPHLNGLPIYGPGGRGVTYIWKVKHRQQAGYYTTFFWANDQGQTTSGPGSDSYYGPHPYPQNPPNGNTHFWEIALDGDWVNGTVTYEVWHTQALRVWSDGSPGNKHHEFYWDLPNTDASHRVIRVPNSPTWGDTLPPVPTLTWGDAPWNPGSELCSCTIRGIQIYNNLLSLVDIQNEINSPLSTVAGSASIWYLNLNPTPTDISDKSGKSHNPVWVGSNRPTLYDDGGGDITPPAAPTNLRIQ